jgi:two-component system nitrogen regulation sensor histidine kinase GlnL
LELPITVEVRDNGPGVASDMIEHLFEPFISSKRSGSGLGLSLVAKILADHRGVVSYLPGEPGATFRVRLPAARAQHEPLQHRDVA